MSSLLVAGIIAGGTALLTDASLPAALGTAATAIGVSKLLSEGVTEFEKVAGKAEKVVENVGDKIFGSKKSETVDTGRYGDLNLRTGTYSNPRGKNLDYIFNHPPPLDFNNKTM